MSNRWRFGGILFQDPRSNICISRRSVLWHLQNVHCSITAHIRTKQVHLGDGEVGVLKSDGSFVFWSLHWAGLWGLGSVGLNEEWGFAMLWACFALRCTLAVRLALGCFVCWVHASLRKCHASVSLFNSRPKNMARFSTNFLNTPDLPSNVRNVWAKYS